MVLWLMRRIRIIRRDRWIGLAVIALLVLCCVLGNAYCYYVYELAARGGTFQDAVWFSIVSITTIGYGDYYPQTLGGRVGTVVFIVLLGLSSFTVFLGMVIDWVTDVALKGRRGMGTAHAAGHVLLIHHPSASRVSQLILELQSDPSHRNREIVVISDQVNELAFDLPHVLFIQGSPLELGTYQRARAERAAMALVLATSYSDPASDAVVASAVSVLDRVNPDLHIVAECLDERHRLLFESVRCDAVVPVLAIGGNLLVQEVDDPGVSQMIDVLTSNRRGQTLFSTTVGAAVDGLDYRTAASRLLDEDLNLMCVNRGSETLTRFRDLPVLAGDVMIYVADERFDWARLGRLLAGSVR